MKAMTVVFLLGLMLVAMASAAPAKTFVYCSEAAAEGFDPAHYTSGNTFDASSRQIYDRLVEFERGATKIVPGLADSWEVSDDGLEYTFRLRPGVKFHTTRNFSPTRDFNADDVVFSFERQRLKDHPYHDVSGGEWVYFDGMSMPDLIRSVEKVDDLTVSFVLNRPEAAMIADLAMDFASIVSKEYADKMLTAKTPEMLDQEPVGTGPFAFVAYEKDTAIRYKANDDYWRGRAAIDDLMFDIVPDSAVRYQKLKDGECHLIPYPDPADYAAMRDDPDLVVLEQDSLNLSYLAYNTTIPPFDNRNVRKALNMAIDKQAILDGVYRGSGVIAKNPIPPIMWSYNDTVEDDAYDPETARRLLEQEGVSNLRMKLWTSRVQRPYNPDPRWTAELIKADFEKIGVGVDLMLFDWSRFLEESRDRDRDGAIVLGWAGDNGDPDNFLAVLLGCAGVGGSNSAQWCYGPFEELVQNAKIVTDRAERTRLYAEAQLIFKEQAPWATLVHRDVYEPMRKEVINYRVDPFGGHYFYGVDLRE